MKPHEETWEADGGCIDQDSPYVPHIGQFGDFSERREPVEISFARAQLAAQAPAMARLLLRLQWIDETGYEGETVCRICGAYPEEGHKPDCALVTVLRAAGVIE